jgi:hypothetical protein
MRNLKSSFEASKEVEKRKRMDIGHATQHANAGGCRAIRQKTFTPKADRQRMYLLPQNKLW